MKSSTASWIATKDYYRELRSYRSAPSSEEAARLRKDFDDLFSTVVAYDVLADRIAKTLAKKDELLLVLAHPELPLHNNASELGARRRARKRDVSLCARTTSGVKAWDTFQSLVATAKKLSRQHLRVFHRQSSWDSRNPAVGRADQGACRPNEAR